MAQLFALKNVLKEAIDEIRATHPEVKGLVIHLEGVSATGVRYLIHECNYAGLPIGAVLKEILVPTFDKPVSSSAN